MVKNPSVIQITVDEHTEQIKILEDRMDGVVKRQVKTDIDVSELKKGMNLMGGNVKIIVDGLERIEKKIPVAWYKNLKWYHWIFATVVFLIVVGGISNL
jgi:hypothetical protein